MAVGQESRTLQHNTEHTLRLLMKMIRVGVSINMFLKEENSRSQNIGDMIEKPGLLEAQLRETDTYLQWRKADDSSDMGAGVWYRY
jgi:hypothetical protein